MPYHLYEVEALLISLWVILLVITPQEPKYVGPEQIREWRRLTRRNRIFQYLLFISWFVLGVHILVVINHG